jgi:hypothetical protein
MAPLHSAVSINVSPPPVAASYNRVRGFFPDAVSEADVAGFSAEFDTYRDFNDASRVTIQLVASGDAIRSLHDRPNVHVEGALPLATHPDRYLTYTAWNSQGRQVSPAMLKMHHRRIERTLEMDRASVDPQATLETNGFRQAHFVDKDTPKPERRDMIADFVELYRKFGHDERAVRDILLDPSCLICYIEDDDGIVSTSLAQTATLQVGGMPDIRVAEITEGVTRPNKRKLGLYRAVSGLLVDRLLADSQTDSDQGLDLVYGEANLAAHGVIIAAHQNGRLFSIDGTEFGIDDLSFGILQQNIRVNDGNDRNEERDFNDFVLTYLPLDQKPS